MLKQIQSSKVFKTNYEKFVLIDTWTRVHVDERQYTCWNKRMKVASRIDFVLISKHMKNNIVK